MPSKIKSHHKKAIFLMIVFLISFISLATIPSTHLDTTFFTSVDTSYIAPEITAMGKYAVRIIESILFSF